MVTEVIDGIVISRRIPEKLPVGQTRSSSLVPSILNRVNDGDATGESDLLKDIHSAMSQRDARLAPIAWFWRKVGRRWESI